MFSTTIKRSIATLGVVAGLLAAAVPASAAPTEELFGNYNFAAEAEGTQQTSRTSSVENCTRMANADYCAVSKEPASKYVPVPAGCAGLDHWINQGCPND